MAETPDLTSPYVLPPDLPVPVDDGACDHLGREPYLNFPSDFELPATNGRMINLFKDTFLPTVLFFYPRSGVPGQPPSLGFNGEEWDSIPGARGCTPQSCGFRDLWAEFRAEGMQVFGVSTQTTEFQREFKERTKLPFELLSDADLRLTRAMRLPTFEFPIESGGPSTLIQRMAIFADIGSVIKVWYPVFPPDRCAANVLAWLRADHRRRPRIEFSVRPVQRGDRDWVREELRRHWGSTTIRSIGRPFEADRLPAFIAETAAGERVGLVTYSLRDHVRPHECEVVTLSARINGVGIGTALLEAAAAEARRAGRTRMFLTTSNDNLRALQMYQRRGWKLVAVHRGMMDRYRAEGSPVPEVGQRGIPLRDEIELELDLRSTGPEAKR